MRQTKTVTEVTCDSCGGSVHHYDADATIATIGDADHDLCGNCAGALKVVWTFLTVTAGVGGGLRALPKDAWPEDG